MNSNTKKILGISAVALALYFMFKPKKKTGAEERSADMGGGGGGGFSAIPILPVVPYTAGVPASQVPVHITITPTGQTATSGTTMTSQAGAGTPSLSSGTTTTTSGTTVTSQAGATTPSLSSGSTPTTSGSTNTTTSGNTTTMMSADGYMYQGGESWGF